jgi:DNA polymerase-3 subunit beta
MHQDTITAAPRAQIIASTADLLRAATACARVVERRNTVPILSNVRILGGNGKIYFTATDLDTELTTYNDATADSRFAATVPAHLLKDFLAKAPKGSESALTAPAFKSVEHKRRVKGEETTVTEIDCESPMDIVAGRARFALQALPITDFPRMEAKEFGHRFGIAGATLREMLATTEFAISIEETRYYLNGVYFHVAPSGGTDFLTAVSTDGHRLARIMRPLPDGAAGMPGVIIPGKAVSVLLKLLAGKACPETVMVSISQTKARFAWPGYMLTTKLIDGTFPDYNRVIPTGNTNELRADSGEMLETLSAVAAMSSERGRAIKLTLEPNESSARADVRNPDAGSSTATFPVDYVGEALEIGFNSGYLRSVIAAACPKGGGVVVHLGDSGSPARVRGAVEGADFVLMPMRV